MATRRGSARAALQRGIDRGELDPSVDLDLCIDLLTGSLLYRLFFSGADVDLHVIGQAVDIVLRGIAAPPGPS